MELNLAASIRVFEFLSAFIIAFKNGEKMNVNEAIKEFKKNR